MPVPNPEKIISFASSSVLNQWFKMNHATESELWVKIYKKGEKLSCRKVTKLKKVTKLRYSIVYIRPESAKIRSICLIVFILSNIRRNVKN